MDWAGPPGGLEKLFAQYDHIVHEGHLASAKPSPIEPNPSPSNPPPDEPPWWSPDEMDEAAAPKAIETLPAPDPLENGASGGFGKLVGSGLAIRAIQSQAGQATARGAAASLRSALPELAEPLLGDAAAAIGTSAAETAALGAADILPGIALGAMTYAGLERAERNQYKNSPVQPGEVTFEVDGKQVPAKTFHQTAAKVKPAPVTFKGDEKGLAEAYMNPVGTSYDPATKSLYVKGSSTATEWLDDARYIPFGDTAVRALRTGRGGLQQTDGQRPARGSCGGAFFRRQHGPGTAEESRQTGARSGQQDLRSPRHGFEALRPVL